MVLVVLAEVDMWVVLRWPPLLKVIGAINLAVFGDQCRELMQGVDSLLMLGLEGEEMSSYSVRSWGERERVGLTERLCGLGEDGEEDRMVLRKIGLHLF